MFLYMPLLWVKHRRTHIVLASLGLVADVMRVDLLAWNLIGRWQAWKGRKVKISWWRMPVLKEGVRIPGQPFKVDLHWQADVKR
jgi:hypothetical protein